MIDRERLSRYLEDELPGAERRALEADLARRPELARELDAMRRLLAAARDLAPAREPARDLWPGIAARLGEDGGARPAASGTRALLAAAAVTVVLAGSFAIASLGRRVAGTSPVAVPAASGPRAAPVPSEEEWAAASQELLRAVEGGLDPATEEIVRRNLEIIDEAVRDIRAAIAEDPSNAGLEKLLTSEYRRRSALLRRTAHDAAT